MSPLIISLVAAAVLIVAIFAVRRLIVGAQRGAEKLVGLRRRAARLRVIADAAPARVMGQDVIKFLLSEIGRTYEEMQALDKLTEEDVAAQAEARRELVRIETETQSLEPPPASEAEAVEMRRGLSAANVLVDKLEETGDLSAARAKSLRQYVKYAIVRSRLESWATSALQSRLAGEPEREAAAWRRADTDAQQLPVEESNHIRRRYKAEADRADAEARARMRAALLADAKKFPLPEETTAASESESESTERKPSIGPELTMAGTLLPGSDARAPFPGRKRR